MKIRDRIKELRRVPASNHRERLATIEHERWADWMKYQFSLCKQNPDGSLTIPADAVKHWTRQIETKYEDLTEKEKDSDREQVDRYWHIILQLASGG